MQETKERACRLLWKCSQMVGTIDIKGTVTVLPCHCYGLCHIGIGYFCKTQQKKMKCQFHMASY